ncbi:MAG: hypothetical protein R3F11_19720 [Verrucomicrobiales bacterium]
MPSKENSPALTSNPAESGSSRLRLYEDRGRIETESGQAIEIAQLEEQLAKLNPSEVILLEGKAFTRQGRDAAARLEAYCLRSNIPLRKEQAVGFVP